MLPLLDSLLAADDSSGRLIFQVLFVVVMIVAWVVRSIAQGKQRRQAPRSGPRRRQPQGAAESGRGGFSEPARTTPDVVYGARPLEHPPQPLGSERAPRPPPPQRSEAPLGSGGRATRDVETLEQTTSTTEVRRRGVGRRAAQARLGVLDAAGSMRRRARMAFLWTEVLGQPRAIRGPHRAPMFIRGRR